ncbi:MAG: helix-turn-helix domain-containing protein [Gemmatimonadaceae bacterium]
MDIRRKLLEATAIVFAETGYRGATTRRIALAAGVNEVSLFRHFGSKDALIREALSIAQPTPGALMLAANPVHPLRELTAWSIAQFHQIHAARSIIRKSMGEMEEHPEISDLSTRCPRTGAEELTEYFGRLVRAGLADASADARSAARMLMNAIFAEALTRDLRPHAYEKSVEQAMSTYVTLILRAVGVAGKPRRPARKSAAKSARQSTREPARRNGRR